MNLSEHIFQKFTSNHWTLALAESCTGGAVSSILTTVPGASKYFLGSVIAYSEFLKQNILRIDPKLLQVYGSVSQPVTEAMAFSIQQQTDADVSLAVTGIAGPGGGLSEKPIGTVFISIVSNKRNIQTFLFQFYGARLDIIHQAREKCLSIILEHLH